MQFHSTEKFYNFDLKIILVWSSIKHNKNLSNIIYDFLCKVNLDLNSQTEKQTLRSSYLSTIDELIGLTNQN